MILSIGLHSTQAASKRKHVFLRVVANGRMFYSERTINTTTVVAWLTYLIVMIFAKVSCAAEVEGFSTAFVTLPSDVFMAMNRAVVLSSTNLFNSACFADKVLFFGCFGHLQVSFALNLAAVVGLFAGVTLVES